MDRILRFASVLALVAGVQVAAQTLAGPASADTKPKTVIVYYMDTVNGNTLDTMGCTQANRVDNDTDPNQGIMILTFGAPRPVDTELTNNGASLFNGYSSSGSWKSTTAIGNAAKSYSDGFYRCLGERSTTDYNLVIAVSNQYPDGNNSLGINWDANRAGNHGTAWGQMVSDVRSYQANHGYTGVIIAEGGVDSEAGYAGPTMTRHWVDGFDGTPNSGLDWNFGSADGCPQFGQGGTGCNGSWTQSDYYYIAWQVTSSESIPQIYNANMAEEWTLISVWGVDNTNHGKILFSGPLSEHAACGQVGCSSGFDDTPDQAWSQFTSKLAAKPKATVNLGYSDDIKWLNP